MSADLFNIASYDYALPSDLIAQHPSKQRDHSRLLLVNRQTGNLEEIKFCELTDFLEEGDSLIFNNTKVLPARLQGKREAGGESEIFLLKPITDDIWEVLVRPAKKLKIGTRVFFSEKFFCEVVAIKEEGIREVRFFCEGPLEAALYHYGQMPLPPYIRRDSALKEDLENYQTVYAKKTGAVAAPTAGLHFTKELLEKLKNKQVNQYQITLHVGLGTFKPVQKEDIREHSMHAEPFEIDAPTAEALNQLPANKKQICVGTTCCRSLESVMRDQGKIVAGEYLTDIFIYPGYQFKFVKALLTNFHAPRSTLLMLVSAFGGYELMREAYKKAVKERFRFHSYGDAMLIY